MPQASDEQRAEWGTDGGPGDGRAIAYLKANGYKLTRGWQWIKPSKNHIVTSKESGAIWFLIDEWDFGGIIAETESDSPSPTETR